MNTKLAALHDQAMSLATEALMAEFKGDTNLRNSLNRAAFEKEKEATLLLSEHYDFEPTRSVLCRSAASLAIDCELYSEAEKLLALGLSGNPPEEIANEMRDLLEQVYRSKHLELKTD